MKKIEKTIIVYASFDKSFADIFFKSVPLV